MQQRDRRPGGQRDQQQAPARPIFTPARPPRMPAPQGTVSTAPNAAVPNPQQGQQQMMRPANMQMMQPSNMQMMQPSNMQMMQPSNMQMMQPSNMQMMQPSNMQMMQPSNMQMMQPSNMQMMRQTNMQMMQPSNMQMMWQANMQMMRQATMQMMWQANMQMMRQATMQMMWQSNMQMMRQANMQMMQPSNMQMMRQANMQMMQPANMQPANMQPVNMQMMQPSNMQMMQPSNMQMMQPANMQPANMQPANMQPANMQMVTSYPTQQQTGYNSAQPFTPLGWVHPHGYSTGQPMLQPGQPLIQQAQLAAPPDQDVPPPQSPTQSSDGRSSTGCIEPAQNFSGEELKTLRATAGTIVSTEYNGRFGEVFVAELEYDTNDPPYLLLSPVRKKSRKISQSEISATGQNAVILWPEEMEPESEEEMESEFGETEPHDAPAHPLPTLTENPSCAGTPGPQPSATITSADRGAYETRQEAFPPSQSQPWLPPPQGGANSHYAFPGPVRHAANPGPFHPYQAMMQPGGYSQAGSAGDSSDWSALLPYGQAQQDASMGVASYGQLLQDQGEGQWSGWQGQGEVDSLTALFNPHVSDALTPVNPEESQMLEDGSYPVWSTGEDGPPQPPSPPPPQQIVWRHGSSGQPGFGSGTFGVDLPGPSSSFDGAMAGPSSWQNPSPSTSTYTALDVGATQFAPAPFTPSATTSVDWPRSSDTGSAVGTSTSGPVKRYFKVEIKRQTDNRHARRELRAYRQLLEGREDPPEFIRHMIFEFALPGTRYLVFDNYPRGSLNDVAFFAWDVVPDEVFANALWDMLEALHMLHRKEIVHSFIQPGSWLVDISGRLKLSDFIMATSKKNSRNRYTAARGGALGYTAPEIYYGFPFTHSADWFSVGLIGMELLGIKEAGVWEFVHHYKDDGDAILSDRAILYVKKKIDEFASRFDEYGQNRPRNQKLWNYIRELCKINAYSRPAPSTIISEEGSIFRGLPGGLVRRPPFFPTWEQAYNMLSHQNNKHCIFALSDPESETECYLSLYVGDYLDEHAGQNGTGQRWFL